MWRIGIVLPAALVALLRADSASAAKPQLGPPLFELRIYQVKGRATSELSSDLFNKAPKLKGETGLGRTDFMYNSHWKVGYTSAGYHAEDVNVDTRIVITMPMWVDYDEASECMRAAWETFYSNLLSHELHHIELAQELPAKIADQISALPPQPTSAKLKPLADAAIAKAIRANQYIQNRFEKDTHHGAIDPIRPVKLKRCKR